MAADGRAIAVLGATGYTGELVCEAARELGLSLRLVGRDEQALRRAAQGGEEVGVADAADHASVAAALEGAFAVIHTAGPFLKKGFAVVDAAIAAGVHYVDSSTEQAYSRTIYERFGTRAAERGLVLLTAFANAPGDFAAGIAAEGRDPLDEVIVANEQSGLVFSRGSRRTLAEIMEQPQSAWENGALLPSRFGATTRHVRFPSGERTVVEWPGPEPLAVPRHVDVRTVRSYARAPRAAAVAGRFADRFAPLVRLSTRVGREGPSPEKRRKARFTVVAEARGPSGGRRATILGRDVYGTAALLLARAADGLARDEASQRGALAPAEAFEPRQFLARAAPLLQLESVVDL
ncbi:MAG TPA: NmrA family NAD(P)-binding protein [Gaiellaceae bacterium]|nr:NmrA family NAD(P)-binding protein [Gaiellaceae bacterium]